MTFVNKRPPVTLKLSVKEYNLLITILKSNELINNEVVVESAKKLEDKLLKYSVPHIDNNTNEEYINIGFYSKEATDMMTQFLIFNNKEIIDLDYYKVLLELRNNYLKSKKGNV